VAKDDVTVLSIGIGRMKKKDLNKLKKAQMAYGGMANGKKHNYAGGGSVTDKMNPGLRALAKERPDVVKKMLGN